MTDLAVQQLFDAKAAAWPDKYAPGGRLTGRLTRLADAMVRYVPPGGLVLDLGCGTGEMAAAAAAAGMRAVGCDISAQMLRRARIAGLAGSAQREGSVQWVRLDPGWQTLPLRAGSCDAVVASSVLEYVADPVAVLRECCRVLRPGGMVLCTVPDPAHPVRWLERLLATAARPPVTTLARRWPRPIGYVSYLRVSRHRHPARWWLGAARRAGLLPAAAGTAAEQGSAARRSPLRLITLTRPAACLSYPPQGPARVKDPLAGVVAARPEVT
jgi:ubiquinone/menaquinone biosynthesis C-methylase UbiE